MVLNEFWTLLLGVKNEKLGIGLEKIYMPEKRWQNLAETDGDYIAIKKND